MTGVDYSKMAVLSIIAGVVMLVLFVLVSREFFDIATEPSSAWDWNTVPGYGAGYGTGYAMWGVWPSNVPDQPWKNWMWARRPSVFVTPFTPVPQIDYNYAPYNSDPVSNYNVNLISTNGRTVLAMNGFPRKTLQLDRERDYYFHIFIPHAKFVVTDNSLRELFKPVSGGSIRLRFTDRDPAVLYYMIPGDPQSGGIIYLNSIRGKN